MDFFDFISVINKGQARKYLNEYINSHSLVRAIKRETFHMYANSPASYMNAAEREGQRIVARINKEFGDE